MFRTLRNAALALAALAPAAANAQGADNEAVAAVKGDLLIEAPYAVQKQNGILAAFMTIHNGGSSDILTSVSSDAAERAVLANVVVANGNRSAQQITSIPVQGGSAKMLDQDGQHIVLIGLRDGGTPGTTIPLTLNFQNAGEVELEVSVALFQ